jgi:hypothetical protein
MRRHWGTVGVSWPANGSWLRGLRNLTQVASTHRQGLQIVRGSRVADTYRDEPRHVR